MVLGLSVLAEYIGLAAIIGAFLGGIVLSETQEFLKLEKQFKPLGNLLVPFFFVVMGTKFNIVALLNPETLILLTITVVVAIVESDAIRGSTETHFRDHSREGQPNDGRSRRMPAGWDRIR